MGACLKCLLERLRDGKALTVNLIDLVDSLRFSLRESIEAVQRWGYLRLGAGLRAS